MSGLGHLHSVITLTNVRGIFDSVMAEYVLD
jgi:hypothetical protein